MIQSMLEDLKATFKYGHMVNRLIVLNVIVFVIVNLVYAFSPQPELEGSVYYFIRNNLAISSELMTLLVKPWTFITHMFMHKGFWHILWNMLLLLWFGRIVGDLLGDKRVLPIYIYGGLFGGVIYVLSAHLPGYGVGIGSFAMGASAAVMAMVVAAAVAAPEYYMRLLLIGNVQIKYIALALVFMDIIGIGGHSNVGGHFAHLGGAFFGGFFVYQLRNGYDLSIGFNKFIDMISNRNEEVKKERSPLKVSHRAVNKKTTTTTETAKDDQERIDAILDKINAQGYEKLSDEEKQFLFIASKK